jgi:hypothetical protein
MVMIVRVLFDQWLGQRHTPSGQMKQLNQVTKEEVMVASCSRSMNDDALDVGIMATSLETIVTSENRK